MLVHCHPSSPATGAYSFRRARWDFMCAVFCVHRHRTSCFKFHPRRLGNIQLIPYPKRLQQNKRLEWESNLYPSASTGSTHYPSATVHVWHNLIYGLLQTSIALTKIEMLKWSYSINSKPHRVTNIIPGTKVEYKKWHLMTHAFLTLCQGQRSQMRRLHSLNAYCLFWINWIDFNTSNTVILTPWLP